MLTFRILFVFSLYAVLATPLQAQPSAQEMVALLTSPALDGRGHADGGADRAARLIAAWLAEAGVAPVADTYLHPFPLRQPVFRGGMSLVVEGDTLRLGDEFLPFPGTGSGTCPAAQPCFVDENPASCPSRVALLPHQPADRRSSAARVAHAFATGAAAVFLETPSPMYSVPLMEAPGPVFQVHTRAWREVSHVACEVEVEQQARLTGVNVLGQIRGTRAPDSLLVLMAHYDHLGRLSPEVYFPGANDNASGTALLVDLARHLAENPLPYTVLIAATGAEEMGLLGSTALVQRFPFPLSTVKFVLNLDMVASGQGGFFVFGGLPRSPAFDALEALNQTLARGPVVPRESRPNSDLWPFTEVGLPGFTLLARDGTQPYHTPQDVAETLEWDVYHHAYTLTRTFLETFLP